MRDADVPLAEREDVVPELRLLGALQLREVEVRPAARVDQLLRVVEEVEAEIDERAGCRQPAPRSVGEPQVLLRQVPAARAHHDRGSALGRDLVGLARCLGPARERQLAADRVAERQLPLDHVLPGGGGRVLLVGEPDPRPGVEGVDRHLRVGRAGDLDAAVLESRARARDRPLGVVADVRGVVAEPRVVAVADLEAAAHPVGEPVVPAPAEPLVQLGEEGDGIRGEDLVVAVAHRPGDLDRRGVRVGAGSGPEPCRGVVVGGEPVSVMVMVSSPEVCVGVWGGDPSVGARCVAPQRRGCAPNPR